jgi:spore maturation protein CgeB
VFVDKKNVYDTIKEFNNNVDIVADGFDALMEKPIHYDIKDLDVSFIGQLYGDRLKKVKSINHKVSVISNAFAFKHSQTVGRSKINLNFCTSEGPSNRVYKILASKGFLLTDDWKGRDEHFEDGKHFVIFKNIEDLNEKISYYLENEEERNKIAEQGHSVSHNYTRDIWASKCLEILKAQKII